MGNLKSYLKVTYLLIIFTMVSGIAFADACQWTIEPVDTPAYFTGLTSRALSIDSNGHPHIVYGNDALYHAYHDGDSWHHNLVDSLSSDSYASVSMAIDSSGYVYISYIDATNNTLRYTTNVSGSWVTETLGNEKVKNSSIVIDKSDKAHIIYLINEGSYALKYATNHLGPWTVEIIEIPGDARNYLINSIDIDSSNKVHISYMDVTNYEISHATNASGLWTAEFLDYGYLSAIASDSSDNVYVCYWDQRWQIWCTTNASGSWTSNFVDGTVSQVNNISIAVDLSDKVHISYGNRNDYFSAAKLNLKYATNASGSWMNRGFDRQNGDISYSSSIATDLSGNVHISYIDSSGVIVLKYMSGTPTVLLNDLFPIETVDSSYNVGLNNSITTDSKGNVHISYTDTTYGLIKYATNTSGLWITETLHSAGNAGNYARSFIAADSSDYIHIASSFVSENSMGNRSYGVDYVTNISGSWKALTSFLGDLIFFSLDSSDKAHIIYFNNNKFMYRTNASGSWINEIVGIEDKVWHLSSAIDSLGKVHMSYRDSNGDLKYATNISNSWALETMDSGANAIIATSIITDRVNNVHIGYLDFNKGLMYAMNKSSFWAIEAVDSSSGHRKIAMASDSFANIYFSYSSGSVNALKFASNTTGSWVSKTLIEDVVGDKSITVGPSGNIHIGYYDSAKKDLKYAVKKPPESYNVYDTTQDCAIGDFELLDAIDAWATGNLGDFVLLDLIDFWAVGCYQWDAVAGRYVAGCPQL